MKQGEPLSPLLFNLVMDNIFCKLPAGVAARIEGLEIKGTAFADDLILCASSQIGLQRLIDCSTSFLRSCGMSLNAGKCRTIAFKLVPREKRIAVDRNIVFDVGGVAIPSLQRTDQWSYLSIPFTAEGRALINPIEDITTKLEVISKAP